MYSPDLSIVRVYFAVIHISHIIEFALTAPFIELSRRSLSFLFICHIISVFPGIVNKYHFSENIVIEIYDLYALSPSHSYRLSRTAAAAPRIIIAKALVRVFDKFCVS